MNCQPNNKGKNMKKMLSSVFGILFSFALMGNSLETFQHLEELEEPEILEMPYPYHYELTTYDMVEILATRLEIHTDSLWELINYETVGTMSPVAKNPISSAKGMIQFVDATARTLKDSSGKKYKSSKDLIDRCSSQECQLAVPNSRNRYGGPVYQYLKRFGKLDTKQKLYMAVFHPKSMNKDINHKFSSSVKAVNPGISSVSDYITRAEQAMPKKVPYYD